VTRQLSVRDVRAVVSKVPTLSGIVLVGGQALNYWAEALGIATEDSKNAYGPAVSGDIDFLGSAKAAIEFGRAVNGKVKVAGLGDASPNAALVTLDIEGEEHQIDFLSDLKGFSAVELEKLKALAARVGLVAGDHQPILVMHPVHCLKSQLENVYGQLNRRAEPGGDRYVGRINLAIEACRRITLQYIERGDNRSALNIAEEVHNLSMLPSSLRARREDNLNVAGAIPVDAMPAEFREKRYPHMQASLERKFVKSVKIYGAKQHPKAAPRPREP